MTILSEKVEKLLITFTTSKNSTEISENIKQTSFAAYEFRMIQNDSIKTFKIDFGDKS